MRHVHRCKRFEAISVVVVLLVHVALLGWASVDQSPTYDEPAHIAAGLSHWSFARYDLYRVNPPLVRMWATLPVALCRPATKWDSMGQRFPVRAEFSVGRDLLEANGERFFQYAALARWACIPVSVLGAIVCCRWARELYGAFSGILALILWCFSPNIIAHGELVTPDVGAAAFGVGACYVFWRWTKNPTWSGALAGGLTLGLALLTKMTWLLLFLLWPVLWLVGIWCERGEGRRRSFATEATQLATILAIALFAVNAGYGFEGSFERLGDFAFLSAPLTKHVEGKPVNRFRDGSLSEVPVPLPANYVLGIDQQKFDFEKESWSYLRGEWRNEGWWYYYLYGLAVKVPLGTWALILLPGGLCLLRHGYAAPFLGELFLLAPIAAVLVLVSSETGMNEHLRYVLPIFPFAFIWTSKVARCIELRQWKTMAVAGGLLVWSVWSSLAVYPHSLSYFNELAGGPTGGHNHLLGSNVDWGQDLFYLKQWLDDHSEARLRGLAFFNSYSARAAGVDFPPPPAGPDAAGRRGRDLEETGPLPGWYALSVNEIRDYRREYDYFLRFQPVAMAGYSIYIYNISVEEANRVRGELGLPELPGPE